MSVELKHHPEEWFFLHNFDIDKVFSTIQRADYLILYYIKMQAEQHPDRKVYLADLAAVMGLKVTELSKAVEKLQDKGFVAWKTDREAGAAADETAGETTAETQPVPAMQAADPPSKDDPLLLLVSRAHPLAEDYAPELTQLHDWPYSIAAIAYEPLRQMLAAGRAEGLSFTVASAYRSTDSQRQLFDEDVEARVSEGMTEDEAREETARWTMPPGCSEHETGLAVDIVATDNQRLDDTQEQTPETIWLHENCWRFGFILRYPAGKEDVTGIDYESWHYRYVGVEAARYLTEQQLTLDEFWAS